MTTTVLVVEDESMIAMLIEDRLLDLGYEVAVAPDVRGAMAILGSRRIDLALLDVNLGGTPSTPVAFELEARGIPYMIATGYGVQGVDPALTYAYCLQKPFRISDLDEALKRVQPLPASVAGSGADAMQSPGLR